MNTYKVGQVIYAVLRKEARVYPLQVIEEVTKRTLAGVETSYVVKGGNDDKLFPLANIDGEIFDTAEKVRQTLVDRATAGIAERVNQATLAAKKWFPEGFETTEETTGVPLKSPVSKPPRGKKQGIATETADLVEELKREAARPTMPGTLPVEETVIVELPDGTKARVRNIKVPEGFEG